MNSWTLRTDDGITLLNPQGKHVPLAYRKVGELLVALQRAPKRTCPRSELGALLWPSSTAAQQATNLRQAIKNLRSAIGAENVFADRIETGLAENFQCHLLHQTTSDPMPGWLSGWTLFLEALSYSSPVQFFEAIWPNVDLLCDLPTPQLGPLVERAAAGLPDGHRLDGAREFTLGSVSFRDIPKANKHFQAAAKRASETRDTELFSRSAFWICACEILRGRVDQAEGLASEALDHVKGRGVWNESLLATARATALLHKGRFAESRALMSDSAGVGSKTVFEYGQHQALRAYYLATSGYEGEAMRLVESLQSNSNHHQGGRVGILIELTCAAVDAVAAPWRVVDALEPRIKTWDSIGQHHFALYATETLVSALARCNLKHEAHSKFQESRRVRRGLGISYSAWDRRRLAPFIAA